jgi:hypothetical protein
VWIRQHFLVELNSSILNGIKWKNKGSVKKLFIQYNNNFSAQKRSMSSSTLLNNLMYMKQFCHLKWYKICNNDLSRTVNPAAKLLPRLMVDQLLSLIMFLSLTLRQCLCIPACLWLKRRNQLHSMSAEPNYFSFTNTAVMSIHGSFPLIQKEKSIS